MFAKTFLEENRTSDLHRNDPRRYFHEAWYAETYLQSEGAIDPWNHYVLVGEAQGAFPHPLFCPDFYRSQAQISDGLALQHYARFGLDRMIHPHPLVRPTRPDQDLQWFATNDQDAISHLLRPRGQESSSTILRYLLASDDEWRSPNPLFDRSWYRSSYSDEISRFREPLTHYLARGGHQGLATGEFFSWQHFLSKRKDLLLGINTPLEHVLLHEPSGAFTFGDRKPEAIIQEQCLRGNYKAALQVLTGWQKADPDTWETLQLIDQWQAHTRFRELNGSFISRNETTAHVMGSILDVANAAHYLVIDEILFAQLDPHPYEIESALVLSPESSVDVIKNVVETAREHNAPIVTTREIASALAVYQREVGIELEVLTPDHEIAVNSLISHDRTTSIATTHPTEISVSVGVVDSNASTSSDSSVTALGVKVLLALLVPGSSLSVRNPGLLGPVRRRELGELGVQRNIKIRFLDRELAS